MNGAIKHGTSAAPWFVFLNYHSTYQRAHLEYDNYNTNDNAVSQTCLGLFRRPSVPNGTKDIGNRCVDWSCSNLESGCCGGRLMVSV